MSIDSGALTDAGWSSAMPSSRAASATGGERQLAAASPRPVGTRHDQRRPMGGLREPPQNGRGELGGAEVDGAHAPAQRSRRRSEPLRSLLRLAQDAHRLLALLA